MCLSGSIECRCVPERASRTALAHSFSLNASCTASLRHSSPSRSAEPSGSAATNAPLMGPIEVPTTRSGLIPASESALSMPTSCAPSSPPPPSTNAVLTRTPSLSCLDACLGSVRVHVAALHRPREYSERGPQGALGDHGEDAGVPPLLVDR